MRFLILFTSILSLTALPVSPAHADCETDYQEGLRKHEECKEQWKCTDCCRSWLQPPCPEPVDAMGPGAPAKTQFDKNKLRAQSCLDDNRAALTKALRRRFNRSFADADFRKARQAAGYASSVPEDEWVSVVNRQQVSEEEKTKAKGADGFTTPSDVIYIRNLGTPDIVVHEGLHVLIGHTSGDKLSDSDEESFVEDFIREHRCPLGGS